MLFRNVEKKQRVLLTSSKFKYLPNKHEAGLGQCVFPTVHFVAVVRQVAVIVSVLLQKVSSIQ